MGKSKKKQTRSEKAKRGKEKEKKRRLYKTRSGTLFPFKVGFAKWVTINITSWVLLSQCERVYPCCRSIMPILSSAILCRFSIPTANGTNKIYFYKNARATPRTCLFEVFANP